MIDIKVNGEIIGRIDPETLTWGDQIDLEEAKTSKAVVQWMVKHAGSREEALRAVPPRRIKELVTGLSAALIEAADSPL